MTGGRTGKELTEEDNTARIGVSLGGQLTFLNDIFKTLFKSQISGRHLHKHIHADMFVN